MTRTNTKCKCFLCHTAFKGNKSKGNRGAYHIQGHFVCKKCINQRGNYSANKHLALLSKIRAEELKRRNNK